MGNYLKLLGVLLGMSTMTESLLDQANKLGSLAQVTGEEEGDPDLDLVVNWQAGSQEAFSTLVQRHQQRVFRLLFRIESRERKKNDFLVSSAETLILNVFRPRFQHLEIEKCVLEV